MRELPIFFSAPMVRAILDGRKTQTRRPVRDPFRAEGGVSSDVFSFHPADGGEWKAMFCAPESPGGLWPKSWTYRCPYGQPGDRLWVREAWQYHGSRWTVGAENETRIVVYVADGARREVSLPHPCHLPPHQTKPRDFDRRYLAKYPADCQGRDAMAWDDFLHDWWQRKRPSIHMPRWASRITLEVTAVRVERVQEITDADARAEGVALPPRTCTMYDGIWRDCFPAAWDATYAAKGLGWDANPWVWVVEFRKLEVCNHA